MYYTYLLKSEKDDVYYIGFSEDVLKRERNLKQFGSAYTALLKRLGLKK